MSFDLNIGNELLEHLKIEDAIKEIISNALDEHIMCNIDKPFKIYKVNNQWIIKDYGTGLKEKHFKIEINKDKTKRNDVVGMFGFGLKDALAILNSKKIDVTIITKKNIYKPAIQVKIGSEEQTLHIDIKKNTTIELDENCGTEIRFTKLKDSYVEKAKNKFLIFLQPEYLFEDGNTKIFQLDNKQSIFINGVEVFENTGFHFSYNLQSNDEIRKTFNRDRKQIDTKMIKKYVQQILQQIIIIDECNNIINDIFFNKIKDIFTIDTDKKLQEFSNKNVIRNIIIQINNLEKYLFVGKTEQINKYENKIKECGCESFILGDAIKLKFKVKSIKELYHFDKFYVNKTPSNSLPIHTILAHSSKQDKNQEIIRNKISTMLVNLEKIIIIPDKIKNKLSNINIDESLNDGDFDFTDELIISKKITDNKIAGIIFEYIMQNIEDKEIIYNKLGELLISKKSWFGIW